jgi:enamine deaminase RidA (YjgF/YER057c/UK114 family)
VQLKKETLFYEGAAVSWPKAVKAGNTVHFAVAGVDGLGNVVGPNFEQQLEFMYKQLQGTLNELGGSMEEILQMTLYYVDLASDLEKAPQIRKKYIPDHKMPIVAAIGVKELAAVGQYPLLVEATGSAIVPDRFGQERRKSESGEDSVTGGSFT